MCGYHRGYSRLNFSRTQKHREKGRGYRNSRTSRAAPHRENTLRLLRPLRGSGLSRGHTPRAEVVR